MNLSLHQAHKLTKAEKEFFIQNGYLIVPDAIDAHLINELEQDSINLAEELSSDFVNTANVISRGGPYLKLATLTGVLPKITGLLGWNIWINHSHTNIHPPNSFDEHGNFDYGWHRDGGAIEQDLAEDVPWFGIKVGFFLSSTEKNNSGTTLCIPGSHKDNRPLPGNFILPPEAKAISIPAGSAILMHPRIVHSIRSPNLTRISRKVVFIQWAYRWLHPVDANTTSELADEIVDPYERQLLGLSTNPSALNEEYASGRSGWYYPGDDEVPLKDYVQKLYGSSDKRNFELA